MFSFSFGQKKVAPKDFYKQRQITDLFTINIKKVVLSNKKACNNRKGCRFIVGYQVNSIIPLFIKAPIIIISYGMS